MTHTAKRGGGGGECVNDEKQDEIATKICARLPTTLCRSHYRKTNKRTNKANKTNDLCGTSKKKPNDLEIAQKFQSAIPAR